MVQEPFPLARRRRGRRIRVVSMVAVVVIAMAAYVAVVLRNRPVPSPPAIFDPGAVVRLQTVSTVYAIRAEPAREHRLWFATAEGIRVLDTRTFEWRRFGLDHGLPSEIVYDICFAPAGPWVATEKGVARLDTAAGRFVAVTTLSSRTPLRVLAIASLGDAGLFFAADSAGFHHISPTDSVARPLRIPQLVPAASSACLKAIGTSLYIGTVGRTVLRYDPATGLSRPLVFDGNRPSSTTVVWDLVEYGGRMFVGTSDDGVWSGPVGSDTLTEIHDFPGKGAYVFAVERDGLWCGTPYGLWRYYDDGGVWIHFVNPDERNITDFQVFALARTDTYLWYGSATQGSGYFNKDQVQWRHMRAGLSEANVAAMATAAGMVWTGYGYRGGCLDRFSAVDLQYERNYGLPDGIVDPNIQSLLGLGARVYFGGFSGFGYIDPLTHVTRYMGTDQGLPFGDIVAIESEGDSSLLLAGSDGILRYRIEDARFSPVSGTGHRRVTCMLATEDRLWYGTLAGGLFALDERSGEQKGPYLKEAMRIVGIAPLAGDPNSLFVATSENGCSILDRRNGSVRMLQVPDSIAAQGFRAYDSHIMASRKIGGMQWIGTRAQGCAVYDPSSRRWHALTTSEGLVSNQVRSLYDDSLYIWVGCFGGLARIDKGYAGNAILKESDIRPRRLDGARSPR